MISPTIAIIDEGVDKTCEMLRNCKLEEINIDDYEYNVAIPEELEHKKGNLMHGTNMACIIHDRVPDAFIISVRLFSSKRINIKLLCKALDYCSERKDINIINISLGLLTNSLDQDLLKSCVRCHKAGIIIIAAAHHNINKRCYPAFFPFVYGVGTGFIRNKFDYAYLGNGYINILAKGIHQRVYSASGNKVLRDGTSYAAASFTSIAARVISKYGKISHRKFKSIILNESSSFISTHYKAGNKRLNCEKKNTIQKDILSRNWMLFPTDDRFSTKVFAMNQVKLIMKYPVNPNNIFDNNFPCDKKFVDGFLSKKLLKYTNVLMLGNFLKSGYMINIYFGIALIELFVKNNKHIITWDDHIYSFLKQLVNKFRDFSPQHVRMISKDALFKEYSA